MPLLGQASGSFRESSSALRLLHVGVRNTVGILTDDAYSQTNPPIVTTTGAGTLTTISSNVDTSVFGVLSGSVAFTRPDKGSNYVGGPTESGTAHQDFNVSPLGLFINNAAGNAYENLPAAASGKGPYVSAMGTYASQLFETQSPSLAVVGAYSQFQDLVYTTGMGLMASRNGYLIPTHDSAVFPLNDVAAFSSEVTNGRAVATTIAILKMPADSVQNEIVFDQRI
jgi:hypothetical protein